MGSHGVPHDGSPPSSKRPPCSPGAEEEGFRAEAEAQPTVGITYTVQRDLRRGKCSTTPFRLALDA